MKPPVQQDVIDQLSVLYFHFKHDIDVTWYQDLATRHKITWQEIRDLLPVAARHRATKRGCGKLIEWAAQDYGEGVDLMRGIVPPEDYELFYEFWTNTLLV